MNLFGSDRVIIKQLALRLLTAIDYALTGIDSEHRRAFLDKYQTLISDLRRLWEEV